MIALSAAVQSKANKAGCRKLGKVLDLDELALELRALKASGQTVVHCHGVFDLLHPGHIRHLAEAKRMGDVLVVTITPDRYVNKGPHRPAFTEALRAEVLAALDAVDYVGINRWPTAAEAIELLQPNVYVKGQDYKQASDDVTGGIIHEANAVAAVGGRIEFTDDITFSSSNLINRYLPAYSAEVNEYLAEFRERHSAVEIKGYLEALADLRVLVLGEAILDEYVYVSPLNKSGKEPILAMRHEHREMHAGGSLAIANHLAEFCKSVELVSYVGETNHEDFMRASLKPNVRPVFIKKADSPTVLKRRYVDSYSLTKMFEVYEINDEPLSEAEEAELASVLQRAGLGTCDVALVSDFGHGLITPNTIGLLERAAPFLAVNTQINAANLGFHTISKYPRADYVCIHEGELRLDYRNRNADIRHLLVDLSEQMSCPTVMVTQGKLGSTVFVAGGQFAQGPALALQVVDRIGAGDAVFAISSLCVAHRVAADVVNFIGNVVGAQAVRIVGNSSSIDRAAVFKTIDSLLK
jgi:rfaE bifunctional protein nucleotidyltransferase chain/domain